MAKVQQVKYLMPPQAQDPVILKSTGQTTAVMYIGFSSAELSSAGISDYLTRVVQPLMATIDGVASADILGGQTFAMRLWLDPAGWRRAASRPPTSPPRSAPTTTSRRPARRRATSRSPTSSPAPGSKMSPSSSAWWSSRGGAVVRLEDIANVELGAQSWNSSVAMNGQHAVFIGIQATPDGNPLSLVKGVRALLPEIERNLPPRSRCRSPTIRRGSSRPRSTRSSMTLGEAVGIVVVVIFLFLGSFRAVLIPIVTIPLSLIGAGDHHGGARGSALTC